MTTESTILARIRRALGRRQDARLFRNDCGTAWTGEVVERHGTTVILRNAQRITYGLQPGSSDLIGWQSIEITPDMVGRRVAVFLTIEAKNKRGRLSTRQLRWLHAVDQAGGNAGVARSPQDAETILESYEPIGD